MIATTLLVGLVVYLLALVWYPAAVGFVIALFSLWVLSVFARHAHRSVRR